MKQSEYLNKFKNGSEFFNLLGNKLLVERLDSGEVKTAGGIIVAETSAVRADLRLQKPAICMVLATGNGYYDADKDEYLPLDVKPGNVVILNTMGIQFYSVLPGSPSYTGNTVGMTTEADVQIVFKDTEAYNKYLDAMTNS